MEDRIKIHNLDRKQAVDIHKALVKGLPIPNIPIRELGRRPCYEDGTAPLDLREYVSWNY
jgi:hypothetical protein